MEKLQGNICFDVVFLYGNIHVRTCLFTFSPFSTHFTPNYMYIIMVNGLLAFDLRISV